MSSLYSTELSLAPIGFNDDMPSLGLCLGCRVPYSSLLPDAVHLGRTDTACKPDGIREQREAPPVDNVVGVCSPAERLRLVDG
jgi:hypothetical protein